MRSRSASIPRSAIKLGLESFAGVPGRIQVVRAEPGVVVDYAHTPDAVARTLGLGRVLARQGGGKLVVVFGCGGDRDPGKRAPMGAIAAELADVVIVTTDNPRSEDPRVIADAVVKGAADAPRARAKGERVDDRAEAITSAPSAGAAKATSSSSRARATRPTQIIGGRELPFDDAAVAAAVR